MIGLFSFDGPMYKDVNGVYCNTTLTSELFERYLSFVDTLNIVIRVFPIESTYKEANLKKVDFENVNFVEIGNLNSLTGLLTERRIAKDIIKKQVESADLIFARMPSIISDITIQFCRQLKKKYMVEVGGCSWDAYWNHSLKGKLMAPYVFMKQKEGIKNADYAIYVTEKWLQGRYPSNAIQTNASNVYLEDTTDEILYKRISKIRNYNENHEFVIGTTAAVDVSYKGQQYVIQAISRLREQGYTFKYQMVGKGDSTNLMNLAKRLNVEDLIEFKGVMVKDDVFDWLDTIDLYIQPSKQEGLPRALIEALSRAVPSLGSRTAGIPELLDDDYIFDRGNITQICEVILKIIHADLTQIASKNFEKAKDFNIDKLNSKRNKLYNEYRNEVSKN
ncbi:glycosyltransferase [Klebsiella pneumoniae]|uniref:glycosyltransferase n=1 Tax=Klebsiella pneumoniae TaxID=573 RepID=UPI0011103674|nr:glycosyltransferase [Klebsiella pneumoniae]TMZ95204.1 glycosyltransferase [Klebsiella pneumoniae]